MEKMVNVYFSGKRYSVPADLTIMTAMEYAGYTWKRGCGCRHGFCGACATIYRIKGDNELKTCLACQTQVQEGMYVASIPFFPTDKRTYDINEIKPTQQIMMELYPDIYHFFHVILSFPCLILIWQFVDFIKSKYRTVFTYIF